MSEFNDVIQVNILFYMSFTGFLNQTALLGW